MTQTTTTPQAPAIAGYIATAAERANQIAIYGSGPTEAEAIADALDAVGADDRYTEADYVAYPASAALLAQVQSMGGAISWSTVDGVCVTDDEEEVLYALRTLHTDDPAGLTLIADGSTQWIARTADLLGGLRALGYSAVLTTGELAQAVWYVSAPALDAQGREYEPGEAYSRLCERVPNALADLRADSLSMLDDAVADAIREHCVAALSYQPALHDGWVLSLPRSIEVSL